MHTPNFTAQLSNKAACQRVAASIGCTQTRGRGKGEGSIREMLEYIGCGEVLVMFHIFDDAQRMREVAKAIMQMTDGMHPHDDRYELLRGLSKSLEGAAGLKEETE